MRRREIFGDAEHYFQPGKKNIDVFDVAAGVHVNAFYLDAGSFYNAFYVSHLVNRNSKLTVYVAG